jgi:hypothetical protein
MHLRQPFSVFLVAFTLLSSGSVGWCGEVATPARDEARVLEDAAADTLPSGGVWRADGAAGFDTARFDATSGWLERRADVWVPAYRCEGSWGRSWCQRSRFGSGSWRSSRGVWQAERALRGAWRPAQQSRYRSYRRDWREWRWERDQARRFARAERDWWRARAWNGNRDGMSARRWVRTSSSGADGDIALEYE